MTTQTIQFEAPALSQIGSGTITAVLYSGATVVGSLAGIAENGPRPGRYTGTVTDKAAATYDLIVRFNGYDVSDEGYQVTLLLADGTYVAASAILAKLPETGRAASQASVDIIQASTALITAGKRITVSADVGQSITLKIGDDYLGARAKRIEINDADQSLYTLLRDITLTAREFGFGACGQRDLVTGTFARDTITWTAASGSVPAFTTVFVECSVPITVMAQVGIYDLQITDATGKKFTPVSSQCTLSVDAKS